MEDKEEPLLPLRMDVETTNIEKVFDTSLERNDEILFLMLKYLKSFDVFKDSAVDLEEKMV